MKKFPFTSQGVLDLQSTLYRLDDPDLLKEASFIAEDFLMLASQRLEFEVHLLVDFRNLPITFRLNLGWCLAAIVLGRLPFDLDDLRINRHKESHSTLTVSFSASYHYGNDAAPHGRLVISV